MSGGWWLVRRRSGREEKLYIKTVLDGNFKEIKEHYKKYIPTVIIGMCQMHLQDLNHPKNRSIYQTVLIIQAYEQDNAIYVQCRILTNYQLVYLTPQPVLSDSSYLFLTLKLKRFRSFSGICFRFLYGLFPVLPAFFPE